MSERVLITGASSGIGEAMARQLAAAGHALLLTARRRDRLLALAAELGHHTEVDIFACDLGTPNGAGELWQYASAQGPPTMLINNAGFGTFRNFADTDWPRDRELLQLNIASVVELSHAFVDAHRGRRQPAYLLNVASVAAFQAVPRFATYAASKSFVLTFTEALHDESRGTNIRVSVLCPGGTQTEFHARAGAGDYGKMANWSMQAAATVARAGLVGVFAGRRVIVPGWLNKVTTFLQARLPRRLASRTAAYFMGKTRAGILPPRG